MNDEKNQDIKEEKIEENNQSEDTIYSSVTFLVSEGILKASFTPDSLENPLDFDTCKQLLGEAGFGKHNLEDQVYENFIELSENNHDGEIIVEEHYDASFELKIDKQKMSARIIIKPAQGGEDLIYDEVLESILEQSLHKDFLDTELLAECLSNIKEVTPVIARGIAPINGEDSKFEVLSDTDSISAPKEASNGTINHYETHKYITVKENHPLMRRIPHTEGTAGCNVLGETIPCVPGKEIPFTLDDTVKVDDSDPNLLLSTKSGHPVVSGDTIRVDNSLTLKNASLASGNVRFDGSVQILEEVKPNVVIEASGDIFVKGMVDNASLIAGKNITINAGVINSEPQKESDAEEDAPQCMIIADGTITAGYCNGVHITAKDNIYIEDYAMHCKLHSDKSVIAGANNGKGIVIGGNVYAKYNVKANIIGSDAYVRTDITCGSLSSLKKRRNKLKADIVRTNNELVTLKTVLNKIQKSGTPASVGKIVLKKAKKMYQEMQKLKRYISKQKIQLSIIKKELKTAKKAKLTAKKKLYSNVHISINNVQTINKRDHGPSKITCEDHEIQFN